MNLLEYVSGSPVEALDPLGLSELSVAKYWSAVANKQSRVAARIYANELSDAQRSSIDADASVRLSQYEAADTYSRAAASVARSVRNASAGTAVVVGAVAAAPVVVGASAAAGVGAFAVGVATPVAAYGAYETGQDVAEVLSGYEVDGGAIGRRLSNAQRADRAGALVDAGGITFAATKISAQNYGSVLTKQLARSAAPTDPCFVAGRSANPSVTHNSPIASEAPTPRIRPNPVTAQPRTAPGFKADPHNNVTARPRTVDQFLTDPEKLLGRGYKQGADGQFYSSDWSRRVRFTPSDLAGHKGGPSHGHFEFNGGRNIHIPLTDK